MSNRDARRIGALAVLACATAAAAQVVLYTVEVGDNPNALAVDTIDQTVYVSCEGSDSVYVLDATADSPEEFVVARLPVGDFPVDAVWNPADNTMWVVNKETNAPAGSVTAIDCASNSVITTIEVGPNPTKAAWASVQNKLYTLEHQTVTVIDCVGDTVVGTIGIPDLEWGYTDMVYNPLMERLYLTARKLQEGEGLLHVVDCTTDSIVRTVGLAYGPVKIAYAPSVNRVFVACNEQDTMNVIDCAADSVVAWLPIRRDPTAVMWSTTPVNRVWVACGRGRAVHYMRADLLQVEGLVETPRRNPGALLYNPQTTKVYATCEQTHELLVFNARIPGLIDTVRLSPASYGPYALALYSPMNRIFVTNYWDRDPGTVTVLQDVPGIQEPTGRQPLLPSRAVPNPVGACGRVKLQVSGFEPSRATLVDATGRTASSGGLARDGAMTAPEQPGVYFYVITDGQQTASGRFVIR